MRLEITLSHSLDLPDNTELLDGPSGQLIKIGGTYFSPGIVILQSQEFDQKRMTFEELDEENADLMIGAISSEACSIAES